MLAALVALAYLLGSIPTGLLLGKAYGIDVRKEGSGNIGATNLYRTVGRKVGAMTLTGDCLKGLIPVLAVKYSSLPPDFAAWVGLAAFCGHVFSLFLKFKGGKGVATALGVFLALAPMAVAIAIAVFAAIMSSWRYVSLGSIAAAAIMPVAVALRGGNRALVTVTLIIAVIVILRHHENIRRLIAGTENRFKA
ncbi:MAG: acyl-phosphate glycerol 3-phosphate acyltransferase [Geobacteraceae bacterium GWC2_55_20]|nr:glycerol-3-phosphate 1-O-acyltransferase PlsY [Deltaproteobacteria bacterium]OGU01215.1 MAG: acyl-phosphate glycerol 3-phosphate acyltransferase [Geobacteraceae bacterium GWC2_55_20]OGU26678.1 MAG: acyl-phosphate glycerol 3-phosphate acyltransferase [Geobacteraceae bacterium GWF2_54_21]HBA73254.1 acyl-phosphate glycerol 3-phosphate acyltransferase [Geobacter sp.]HCE68694.1 acyl-phosphate glycerol 3-phosphate acyltransferase [Geobacter sp.]